MRAVTTILILCSLIACKKGHRADCFKGTGDQITETRQVADFTGLRVEDNLEVVLIDTTARFVEINAGEKLLDGITTEIIDDVLTIRNVNKCNFVRDYQRKVIVRVYGELTDIWYDSDGIITNENDFSSDKIIFHHAGTRAELNLNNAFFATDMYQSGSIELTGNCNKIHIELTSYGSFDATNLNCTTAELTNKGEGDIHIGEVDSLEAAAWSVGNIYYKGNPSYRSVYSDGEGKVIKQ